LQQDEDSRWYIAICCPERQRKSANDNLCVKKSNGTPVCIIGDQLAGILSGTPTVQTSAAIAARHFWNDHSPSIDKQGNNPVTIKSATPTPTSAHS
jgi:hypothetical protein